MTDYISRDAAIKRFTFATLDCLGMEPTIMASDVVAALKSLPAAEVREVVRGKWIDHQEGRWIYAKCSECGTVHDVKSNFCPNCGADMRGEAE